MELASPLLPAVFATPAYHDTHPETDLVSFPFSPKHVSSPTPGTPSTPSPTTRQSPGPQDIERVQAALDVARTHLVQKEEALTQLRGEMEKLQLELQAQSQPDGDECQG